MKVTFLGQAGLLFEKNGFIIMVDPYLSDSVSKINPKNQRKVPADERFLKIKPDIIILTHNHLDHTDPETLAHYLKEDSEICVLASGNAWQNVRKTFGGNNNYIMFNRRTVWTEGAITFTAVKAEHSDPYSVGVIIDDGEKKFYVTGDTLYNEDIFGDIPDDIYALFLPVNGVGNNMNAKDAVRFAKRINAKKNIPVHIGMFDELTADIFQCENKFVIKLYEEAEL